MRLYFFNEIKVNRVYFRFTFNSTASLVEAQSFAVKALDDFSDTEKAYYDFHFTLIEEASEKNEGFKIMGAKNVNGTNLVWDNNNAASTSE